MASIFITGGNRGLGLAIAKYYAKQNWYVHASFRDNNSLTELLKLQNTFPNSVQLHQLDVRDSASIKAVKKNLSGIPIDILVNNAGVSIDRNDTIGNLNYDSWNEVLNVNLLGAARTTEMLLDNVVIGERKIITFISSDLASFGAHDGRQLHYYRTSKVALNMFMRTLSFDLATKGIILFAFHPGWIRTDMGGTNAAIDPEQSVQGFVGLINIADKSMSGKYFDWNGKSLLW